MKNVLVDQRKNISTVAAKFNYLIFLKAFKALDLATS